MTKANLCKNELQDTYEAFKTDWCSPWELKDLKDERVSENICNGGFPQYFNCKSSEWSIRKLDIEGKTYLLLVILGSNDAWDWIFWNPNVFSWDGYKLCGLFESKRVVKSLKHINTFNMPLIIGTHSKSGCTGWALYHLCKKAGIEIDSIHAFAPAKGLRKHMEIPEATMYIDKSDPVPKASISLNHPNCKIVYHPEKDGKNIDFSDHSLNHWDGVV